MDRTNREQRVEQPQFTMNVAGTRYQLSVEDAFAFAHQFICYDELDALDAATSVLQWLELALPNDPRVKVLHARCEAGQAHFPECRHLLSESYVGCSSLNDVPDPLHTALVYRAVGWLSAARQEVKELCSRHPRLPSLWLLSGDLWLSAGCPDKAKEAWKLAASCDHSPSLIATTVKHRIQELSEKD